LVYPSGSKRANEEADILSHIQTLTSHEDQLALGREAKESSDREALSARKDYQGAMLEDRQAGREARTAALGESQATRRAGMLQLMASDTSLNPQQKQWCVMKC